MTVPAVERLLVVSPNWLGDAVMALPALSDLRRAFRGARLIVGARASVAGLFAMSPHVDQVVRLEWAGRWMDVGARGRDVAALAGADVAVLLPNSFASAWLVFRAGVRERWGYAADLRHLLLTRKVPRPAIRAHQSQYYRSLVRQLGIENGGLEPELIVPPAAVEAGRALLLEQGHVPERPLVVVAPGAAYGGAKRWPSTYFARTIESLVREREADCALVGSRADAETTGLVRSLVCASERRHVFDLAGGTTLESLAGLMSLASAGVSNDSGAMHLAAAVGVPLAALFGPTRERETTPLVPAGGRVEVLVNHVWCRPCMLRECPLDHQCMRELTPGRVSKAVSDLMTIGGNGVAPETRRLKAMDSRGRAE